jgi:outer membrane biosynthesis protein TonB
MRRFMLAALCLTVAGLVTALMTPARAPVSTSHATRNALAAKPVRAALPHRPDGPTEDPSDDSTDDPNPPPEPEPEPTEPTEPPEPPSPSPDDTTPTDSPSPDTTSPEPPSPSPSPTSPSPTSPSPSPTSPSPSPTSPSPTSTDVPGAVSISPRQARPGTVVTITTEGCLTGGTADSMAFRGTASLSPVADLPGAGASGTAVISSRVQVGDYDVYVSCSDGGATVVTVTVLSGPLPPVPPDGTIDVTPMYVRPGGQVDLRTDVCGSGTVATSPAFARPVRLAATDDGAIEGTATIAANTPAGAYEAFAECEDGAATGTVVVVGGSRRIPSGGVNTGFGGMAKGTGGGGPVGAAMLAAGVLLGGVALRRRAGVLVALAASCAMLTACSSGSSEQAAPAAQSTPVSKPSRVDIPAINAHSTLVPLGLDKNGALAVPPLSQIGQAGWYAGGPAPGEKGAAIIVGHVDSKAGPGVFHDLSKLKKGDTVQVKLTDGATADFSVESVQSFPKDKFPTKQVYGAVSYPALRLITCGGDFNGSTGHYVDNVVAFARMTGQKSP